VSSGRRSSQQSGAEPTHIVLHPLDRRYANTYDNPSADVETAKSGAPAGLVAVCNRKKRLRQPLRRVGTTEMRFAYRLGRGVQPQIALPITPPLMVKPQRAVRLPAWSRFATANSASDNPSADGETAKSGSPTGLVAVCNRK
jgi:hypothetical protein